MQEVLRQVRGAVPGGFVELQRRQGRAFALVEAVVGAGQDLDADTRATRAQAVAWGIENGLKPDR